MPTFAEKIEGLFTRETVKREVPKYSTGAMLKDALKTWAGWRKKQWPFRDMTEKEMMESVDPLGGILKPMAVAKLLKTVPRFSALKYNVTDFVDPASAKHLKDLLKVPGKEFKGLKAMLWKVEEGTGGQYLPGSKRITLNPEVYVHPAARHEFVHKRQWLPRAGKEEELTRSNIIRLLRSGMIKRKVWSQRTDPVELHATLATAMMEGGISFDEAFRATLRAPSVYKPAQEALGRALTGKLMDIGRRAAAQGINVKSESIIRELLP